MDTEMYFFVFGYLIWIPIAATLLVMDERQYQDITVGYFLKLVAISLTPLGNWSPAVVIVVECIIRGMEHWKEKSSNSSGALFSRVLFKQR